MHGYIFQQNAGAKFESKIKNGGESCLSVSACACMGLSDNCLKSDHFERAVTIMLGVY